MHNNTTTNDMVTRRGFMRVAGGAAAAACGAALAGCAAGRQQTTGSVSAAGSGAVGSADTMAGSLSESPIPATGSDVLLSDEDIDPALLEGTLADPNVTVVTAVAPNDPYGKGKHHATIEVEDYGTISLLLDADSAPITVSNFCHLANEGRYDGTTFYRIIPGFMIQGGDPLANGTGGAEWTIKGEFRENGVNNKILHGRGTISMARAEDNDSASMSFFIMHAFTHSLDGSYAGFGYVTSGIEVVDAICEDAVATDDNGSIAPANQPIISKITIID